LNPEIETPGNLTGFSVGNNAFNRSADTFSISLRLATARATVRLREINSKSANDNQAAGVVDPDGPQRLHDLPLDGCR
jgi:hypothetical protein